jgi:hypothetical protein
MRGYELVKDEGFYLTMTSVGFRFGHTEYKRRRYVPHAFQISEINLTLPLILPRHMYASPTNFPSENGW